MKSIFEIINFSNMGFRCVSSFEELKRLKFNDNPNFELLKDAYKIISNCEEVFYKNGEDSYRELILGDLKLLQMQSGFDKANEVFEYRKKEIKEVKKTLEGIFKNYYQTYDLNKAINFFDDLGDKCLSYANSCACF